MTSRALATGRPMILATLCLVVGACGDPLVDSTTYHGALDSVSGSVRITGSTASLGDDLSNLGIAVVWIGDLEAALVDPSVVGESGFPALYTVHFFDAPTHPHVYLARGTSDNPVALGRVIVHAGEPSSSWPQLRSRVVGSSRDLVIVFSEAAVETSAINAPLSAGFSVWRHGGCVDGTPQWEPWTMQNVDLEIDPDADLVPIQLTCP